MGAGAGASSRAAGHALAAGAAAASDAELQRALRGMDAEARLKLVEVLAGMPGAEEAKAAAEGPEVKAEAEVEAQERKVEVEAHADPVEAEEEGEGIPATWGWPKEPYEVAELRQYVLVYTKPSQQEEWDAALKARTADGSIQDHFAEKVFANTMLNKEGTGEDKDDAAHRGIDPNAYKRGKWYRFLNAKGDCNVYVHNYTRDITATRPCNFTELTPEEKAILSKLGVFIKDLPTHLAQVYDKQQQIPIVFASQETAEALKTFALYDKDWQLLDCTKLKRVNGQALEESRQAIVNAMRLGKWLCVYLGDTIPELGEKVCTAKNRDTFPLSLWTYGGLDTKMVKEKIYRDSDKEGGQYVVRAGFRICVVLMYDNMCYEMSSMRKAELPAKIPNFEYMEQVRCYAESDIKKILALNT